MMRSVRFSIAGLMGVVLFTAIGLAALRSSSETWAGVFVSGDARSARHRLGRRLLPCWIPARRVDRLCRVWLDLHGCRFRALCVSRQCFRRRAFSSCSPQGLAASADHTRHLVA